MMTTFGAAIGVPVFGMLDQPIRPRITRWVIARRPTGLKRWQIERIDSGPGYSSVMRWRFAERYQAERFAHDVLNATFVDEETPQ